MKQLNKELYNIQVEIKPCPFCNGEADISYSGQYRFVRCLKCNAKSGYIDVTSYPPMSNIVCYEEAISLWNTRLST